MKLKIYMKNKVTSDSLNSNIWPQHTRACTQKKEKKKKRNKTNKKRKIHK